MAEKFGQDNPGFTPAAAVNGDLFALLQYSPETLTSQVLSVPFGFTVINGEIISTRITAAEHRTVYPNDGMPDYYAFGITPDFVPTIGQPNVDFSIKNTTQNKTATAEGLNRLPAQNALMIYNDRCNTANYALSDALEIVLDNVSGVFKHGQTIKGTVSAIGAGGEYGLEKGKLVLSARGSAKSRVSAYAVGDTVEISVTLTDALGNDDMWRGIETAIGGRAPLILNGSKTGMADPSVHPWTVVGYTYDGQVVAMVIDGRDSGGSQGVPMNDLASFAAELGLYGALVLDGGGSSTMVIDEGSGLTVVNRPSDGAERTVINGLVISTGPQRAPQGNLNTAPAFNPADIRFDNALAIAQLERATDASILPARGAVALRANTKTENPSATLLFGAAPSISADEHPYIVVTARAASSVPQANFSISPLTGSLAAPKEGFSSQVPLITDDAYHAYLFDFSAMPDWAGSIHALQLNFLTGNQFKSGNSVHLQSVQFAKTFEEARALMGADGASVTPAPTPAATDSPAANTPSPSSGWVGPVILGVTLAAAAVTLALVLKKPAKKKEG